MVEEESRLSARRTFAKAHNSEQAKQMKFSSSRNIGRNCKVNTQSMGSYEENIFIAAEMYAARCSVQIKRLNCKKELPCSKSDVAGIHVRSVQEN